MATGSRQKSRDTLAELKVREALRDRGLTGYVTHRTIALPKWGKRSQHAVPDVLFEQEMLAIFVDGCFWHGCPQCYADSKTNTAAWRSRTVTQRARDRRHSRALETLGYRVLRIWEHEDPNTAAIAAEAIIDTDQPPATYGLP